MINWESLGFFGVLTSCVVWYVKHKIETSSKIQLEAISESYKNKNRELLEAFKADLGLQYEIKKTKHLSIYERKVHALLDSFACLSDCESPMGKIAEDCSTNKGENFSKLYEDYLYRKDILLNTFWRNSALFSDLLIEKFQQFKRGILMPYTSAYKAIAEDIKHGGSVTDSHINRLIDLEIEYGRFAKYLKAEIRHTLNES